MRNTARVLFTLALLLLSTLMVVAPVCAEEQISGSTSQTNEPVRDETTKEILRKQEKARNKQRQENLQRARLARRLTAEDAVRLYREADLLALGTAAQAARFRKASFHQPARGKRDRLLRVAESSTGAVSVGCVEPSTKIVSVPGT